MGTWEGRRALILSAAPCEDLEYVRVFLRENPGCLVLCADGGMKYAGQLGITPDMVVADFDSSREAIACRELVRLTPEKDDTDTQHCVSLAIERGCKDITLACATGGRLDFLHGGGRMRCSRRHAKRYISLIPLDARLTGVTMLGLKYPLKDAVLTRPYPISVSNEAVDEQFSIEIGQGRALVIFAEDIPGIL